MANTIGMFETGSKRPGFHMTFTNGNTVSVQWGKYNYCDVETSVEHGEATHLGKNAEIAAWDKDGNWYRFPGDNVLGYQTTNNVASFINFVATSNLSTVKWNYDVPSVNLVTTIKICTKNDINGNPRRAWLVHNVPVNIETGTYAWPRCVGVVDEGYSGRGALEMWLEKHNCAAQEMDIINVSPSEYNKFTSKKWTDVCDTERAGLYGS